MPIIKWLYLQFKEGKILDALATQINKVPTTARSGICVCFEKHCNEQYMREDRLRIFSYIVNFLNKGNQITIQII